MNTNYLKIAKRNLLKNKVFTLLNFIGLSVGIAAFFLIFLYVSFELSYDTYHKKADRIYRVSCDIKTASETLRGGITSGPMGLYIKNEFPEVEASVRLYPTNILVKKGNVEVKQESCMYADPSLFSIFDFDFKSGDAKTALMEPNSVVVTETFAKKYFGSDNPIGQTLELGAEKALTKVTGVINDIRLNSQIKPEFFISIETMKQDNPEIDEQWGNFGASTFLLLKNQTNPKNLEKKFPAFIEKHAGEDLKRSRMNYSLFLEPLKDLYLNSEREGLETGNILNVYIFSIIGLFILLIAFINYINLTTARASERAKEVGIKKVVGAGSMELKKQFMTESILLCFAAFIFSILIAGAFLPIFNDLAGKVVSKNIFDQPLYLLIAFCISTLIGIAAGIYPAFVLSSFKPITILKGKFSTGNKGIALRKGLVITQFTVSIALIIGTLIVYNQLEFMRNQELGFKKDQILIIDTYQDKQKEAFNQEILQIPGVKSSSFTSSIPGGGNPVAYSEIESKTGEMQSANIDLYFVDFDYIPQFDIKVVAGRAFDEKFATDTTQAMVINEAAAKLFGYDKPEDAVGRRFSQWGRTGKIVGVISNFHFRSLKEGIKPLTMRIEPQSYNLLTLNISTTNLKSTIASIEKKWNQLDTGKPFTFTFADELFNKQYRSEEQFGKLFFNFGVLAIIISCIGLLGLALYSTTQRTKEIGIRKTLGASVSNIVNLLSKDFLKLVVYSFCIATPLAWWTMNSWLQNFAYRIDIEWWVFALGGFLAITIAYFTISFQAFKAAVANPVKSLRAE